MNSVLVLTPEQRRQIETEGATAYPNECCGIIFGREITDGGVTRRVVDQLQPVANEFESGEQFHRFLITPQTLFQAEKQCTQGRLVLGFYHSHPDHPARPSAYDLEHGWQFYSYIIVAIRQGDAKEMTSWVLDEDTGRFDEQNIEVRSKA